MDIERRLKVPAEQAGQRLDQVLASLLPDFSRSKLKSWIEAGWVTVDGLSRAAKYRLAGGETLQVAATLEDADEVRAQNIPLEIIYQDPDLLVINKPAGLVVHPGAGNPDRTMQNALLHFDPLLSSLPRSGIVHRLDKDTTGLLVVARSHRAHRKLVAAMEAREVERHYQALCRGRISSGGTINAAIGRHPVQRTKMSVRETGRASVTHYRVRERFQAYTLLDVKLETGRTHQIRVHLSHAGFPLLGDSVYGGRQGLPAGCDEALADELRRFRRQALHAWRLSLAHPTQGDIMQWEAPLPEDFEKLLQVLRQHQPENSA